MIPFLDVGAAYRELKSDIDSAIKRVIDDGWYILGPEVEAFEGEWSAYCGAQYAVGVANGLEALTLALRALDIGPGDEVIVPSHTFIATWLSVSAVGAKPVPVEPDPGGFTISPRGIAEAIGPATRAVLPVHLYGHPADLDPILAITRQCGLKLIEDAAQCHGARYKGRRIGSHGDAVCWSFFPGKNLGAFGDAGAVTTNNADVADRIRVLRNYGSRIKYLNEVQGFNSRLDPIQAAVLRIKLAHLDEWNLRRKALAELYCDSFRDLGLRLPAEADWADNVWHLYVVQADDRDFLQRELEKAGVSTLVHYPVPPHLQGAYATQTFSESGFPLAEMLAGKVLSLPIGPHLSLSDADTVAKAVRRAIA